MTGDQIEAQAQEAFDELTENEAYTGTIEEAAEFLDCLMSLLEGARAALRDDIERKAARG